MNMENIFDNKYLLRKETKCLEGFKDNNFTVKKIIMSPTFIQ